MKKETLDVYERPEAEEVELVIESKFLGQGPSNTEPPVCLTWESCRQDDDFCMQE